MTTHAKRSQTLLKCKDRRLIMSEAIVSGRVKPTCSAMRKVKLLGLLEDYSAILFLLFKPSYRKIFFVSSPDPVLFGLLLLLGIVHAAQRM